MNFNLSHVTTNPIVLCSAVLAAVGWLLTFVAACLTHLHGASWWIIVYELALIITIYLVLSRSLFIEYQLLLLMLLAISIAMLTQLIEMFINRSDSASQAGAAGGCILVIMQYLWVFIFGSSEQSVIHRSIYGMHNTSAPLVTQAQFSNDSHRTGSLRSIGSSSTYHRRQQQQQQQQQTLSEKQLLQQQQQRESLQSSIVSSNPPVSPIAANQQNMNSTSNVTTTSTTPAVASTTNSNNNTTELKMNEAKALHAYRANAEDPNELSFAKHEILEIIDKRGNWWQAKKKDGSIGIVPSNYFAA
ncbi:hypothetical protein BDA99DRAFT_564072 [Phascolomyces articulosus]|uniref:SH3 domain-containing protein n=1 Tax=Phascolomyces articulosus TaxID=60185 RepID=A0AAD5JR75_9FUNG|nr:hypothetical protein BDA99DRAFT_564072 [Phascolomyces articulosus]